MLVVGGVASEARSAADIRASVDGRNFYMCSHSSCNSQLMSGVDKDGMAERREERGRDRLGNGFV